MIFGATLIAAAIGLSAGMLIERHRVKEKLEQLRGRYAALALEHKRWTDRGPNGQFRGGKP